MDTERALSLLETLHARTSTLPKTPVLVLDSDGGVAGSAFCALITLFEQNMHEQQCDVYQAVKTVIMSRQTVWADPIMLMQVYKVVEEMVNKESLAKKKHLQKLNMKVGLRLSVRQWRTGKDNQREERRF